jgi:hypothetical protein
VVGSHLGHIYRLLQGNIADAELIDQLGENITAVLNRIGSLGSATVLDDLQSYEIWRQLLGSSQQHRLDLAT